MVGRRAIGHTRGVGVNVGVGFLAYLFVCGSLCNGDGPKGLDHLALLFGQPVMGGAEG